jgi:hypothetical protein
MREDYLRKVAPEDKAYQQELDSMSSLKEELVNYVAKLQITPSDEYNAYCNALSELEKEQVKSILNLFSEYEKAYNDRQRFYHHFCRESDSEALLEFRNDLLHHLAGSIIVKEHRQRYQQEQFERFAMSMNARALFKNDITLKEFS